MNAKLLTIQQLSKAIGIPVRTLRTMQSNSVIPHLKLGHRTVMYIESEVRDAIMARRSYGPPYLTDENAEVDSQP